MMSRDRDVPVSDFYSLINNQTETRSLIESQLDQDTVERIKEKLSAMMRQKVKEKKEAELLATHAIAQDAVLREEQQKNAEIRQEAETKTVAELANLYDSTSKALKELKKLNDIYKLELLHALKLRHPKDAEEGLCVYRHDNVEVQVQYVTKYTWDDDKLNELYPMGLPPHVRTNYSLSIPKTEYDKLDKAERERISDALTINITPTLKKITPITGD